MYEKNKPNPKYAAIYVRTSSEHQGEKASPDEQESDCRKLAEEHGLIVVAVYRDIERYRVGRRLVEPSGTREDRPGLTNLLRDAKAGKFDTILAWREDRLYRGMSSMVLVTKAIEKNNIRIILAKESFDNDMAPIKAWVAEMELRGMRERMSMGVKARLRAGKANTGQDRYGYKRNGEAIEVVEDEAYWVRQIFAWYNQRVSLMEIRQRLILAGAPQKGSSIPRKIQWAVSTIQGVLKAADAYASGIKIQRRNGEEFQISVQPIIDPVTYETYVRTRDANKKHPTHHLKRTYLIGGLLYCDCERKWASRVASYTRKNRHGEKVDRKSLYWNYYCPQRHAELISPNCPRTISSLKADAIVWEKVCAEIRNPDVLILRAQEHIAGLRKDAQVNIQDNSRLQKELEEVLIGRQWVITQARLGKISEADMDIQLSSLRAQELNLRKELATAIEVVNLDIIDGWEEKAREHFRELSDGVDSINNAAPQTDEERHEVHQLKLMLVRALVQKVKINRERKLTIVFKFNLLELMRLQLPDFCQIQRAGTYSHTQ